MPQRWDLLPSPIHLPTINLSLRSLTIVSIHILKLRVRQFAFLKNGAVNFAANKVYQYPLITPNETHAVNMQNVQQIVVVERN